MPPAVPSRFPDPGTKDETENGLDFTPKFDANGLLPAVVTDSGTGEVLMLAWMNDEALALTLDTGVAHFWTRSRGRIWKKGEESGNLLRVVQIRTDCDQDSLVLQVEVGGSGVACHTGRRSCFYRVLRTGNGSRKIRLEAVA